MIRLCEYCSISLEYGNGDAKFRFTLSSEEMPIHKYCTSAYHLGPEIDKDFYFCDLYCLANWLERDMGI